MSLTQIPLKDPAPSSPPTPRPDGSDLYEARHWESAYRDFDADRVPHLLLELQDDLARSRVREAAWISVIVHLVFILLIVSEPNIEKLLVKWLPRRSIVTVSPGDVSKQKELTYLELPPDAQKLTKKPNTNTISDKDRIAMSQKPHLDAKELKKILDSSRPGTPGPSAPPVPKSQQQPPAVAQNAQPQPQQQAQQQPPPQASQNQIAKLAPPPVPTRSAKNPFEVPTSALSSIQQAERAALANRGATASGGGGGDYGLGIGQRPSQVLGPAEVLSDTQGVDFGPYLQRVVQEVREHWYNIIPPVAQPPIMKQGKLAIEFAILRNGNIAGMKLVATSNDTALDRAAWGGITGSNPFPPLPAQFNGQYLALRFYFFYNPTKNDLE